VGSDDVAAKREYRLAIMFGLPALNEAARAYPTIDALFDIAPATPDGLLELGSMLAASGRPADAAVVFSRLIDEFEDERGTLPLAYAKVALRDDIGALEFARRQARARPADPNGWAVAAEALHRLGRDEEARAEVELGLTASPGSPRLLGLLAERSIEARRWAEAKRLAEEIAPRTPAEIVGKHLLVARTLAAQGRLSEALDRARSAAAVEPEAQGPSVAVAEYASQAGRFDDAIAALRHAASLPGAPPDRYASRISEYEAAEVAQRERAMMGDAVKVRPGVHLP
jgi:hypothetical protein